MPASKLTPEMSRRLYVLRQIAHDDAPVSMLRFPIDILIALADKGLIKRMAGKGVLTTVEITAAGRVLLGEQEP